MNKRKIEVGQVSKVVWVGADGCELEQGNTSIGIWYCDNGNVWIGYDYSKEGLQIPFKVFHKEIKSMVEKYLAEYSPCELDSNKQP